MEALTSSLPSTETSISRPTTPRSTTIFSANSAAWSIAAEISCAAFTRVIPTDDPSVAGFTNNGKRNFFLMAFSTFARSCSHSDRRTARNGTIGNPACSNSRFCTSLSMPTAEASTPAPTYGNPASSINPCTVPSSPNVPCKTGNTTSTPTLGCPAAGPNGTKVAALGSGGSTTRSPDFSTSANNFIELVPTSQRPSFEIPIGTGSYFSGSSARITEAAEASETSCSPERPPNSTPMRNRFCALIAESRRADQICTRASQDFLPQAGKHQFNAQRRSSIVQINHRIHFHHFKRNHLLAVGDHLQRQMRFAIRHAAAHRRAHSRRITRIHKIHIQAHDDSRRIVSRKSQGLSHYFAHATLVNIAHRENMHAGIFHQPPLFGVQVAYSHQHHVPRLHHRLDTGQIRQLRRPVTHDRRQRHAVHVPRRRRIRRVHVAVRVQPNHTHAFTIFVEMCGSSGRRAHSNRMIAAQHQRNHVLIQSFLHRVRQALARLRNFVQITRALLAVRLLLGLRHLHVADILHLPPQLFQARLQSRYAQSRRTHIHAAAARAQVHRHTDNANFVRHIFVFATPIRGREP